MAIFAMTVTKLKMSQSEANLVTDFVRVGTGKRLLSGHLSGTGKLGKKGKDACNKDPLLFISVGTGGCKILIS